MSSDRVFLDGHPEQATVFAHSLGLWERLGGLAAMASGYDRLVGFAQLIAEANGVDRVGHIKEKISEMIINATLIRGSLEAAIQNCSITSDGAAFPSELYTNVGKYHGAANYALMVRHLHDIAGGSVLTAPSIADFENDATGHLVRKYMGTIAVGGRALSHQALSCHSRHDGRRAGGLEHGDQHSGGREASMRNVSSRGCITISSRRRRWRCLMRTWRTTSSATEAARAIERDGSESSGNRSGLQCGQQQRLQWCVRGCLQQIHRGEPGQSLDEFDAGGGVGGTTGNQIRLA